MKNIAFGRKPVKRFDLVDLKNELEAQGLNVRKVGRELKFKVDGDSYVLNPGKGVWIGSTGAGTIAGLLHSLKISTSDLPLAPCSDDNEEARKFADMQRRIMEKINDSRPLLKTERDSTVIARPFLQKIVSDYLASRGLTLELLPEDARVRGDEKGFVELILPLSDNENARSIHVTAIDDNGKHGLDWIEGDSKYTFGPISGYFSVVDGATEQLKIKGKESTDWIAIAEGLETSMSIRLLTGWTTIFAISAGNLTKILTQEMAKNMVREKKGLAISVDRDESGAGQRASGKLAALAREAGIPVLFLVPPAVVRGSEKGADWNDAVKELGRDGAFGALTLAIARSDEELSALAPAVAPVLPMDLARDSSLAPAPVERKDMEEVHSKMWSRLKRYLDSREKTPGGILAVDAGSGKSQTLADLAKDHAFIGSPVVTIAPTKELAAEAASKSQGFFREGRSERPENAGFCPIYPDIEPFSERWRSVVAHKCVDCKFGKAAMAVIRGEEATGDDPCQYILHVNEARQAPVLSTTGAMLEGDPFVGKVKDGEKIIQAKVVLDDTCEIADHRVVHGGHVAEWTRAASRIIETSGENKERAEATKALLPWLSSLSRLLADNPGEEQIRLSPAEWTEFSTLVGSSALKWVDGITAEAIFKDSEGSLEIPLRTLKALGEAIERGTAWVRKGVLHFAVSTRAVKAIEDGALILDATPSLAVRSIVKAQGGEVTEIRARQDSLRVTQVLGAGHGKTSCSPDSPSFQREKMHFLNTVRATAEKVGSGNLAVLTHKALSDSLSPGDLSENVEIGHWGLDDRGHNRWERKTTLMIWGVQRLAPSTAERIYMAERQAVIEAGGEAWPEWDGEQTEKWYQVPGQAKEIFSRGYKDEFIDQWAREWTTSKVVQAVGRLRATRRTDPLEVIIHSNFPLSEAFGMEIHALARPDWRTMNDYQKSRKDGQVDRAVVAIAALGEDAGRRKINDWLKSKGMAGIKPENWAEIKKMAGGSQREYISFVSGTTPSTTPDFFGRDAALLVEKLDEWANLVDLREIVEITYPFDGTEGWTPVEAAGLFVLHAVLGSDEATGGLPDPVPLPDPVTA